MPMLACMCKRGTDNVTGVVNFICTRLEDSTSSDFYFSSTCNTVLPCL